MTVMTMLVILTMMTMLVMLTVMTMLFRGGFYIAVGVRRLRSP